MTGRRRQSPGWPLHRQISRIICATIVLWTIPVTGPAQGETVPRHVLKSALTIVSERYIDPVAPARLVGDAIEGLTRLDSELAVTATPDNFLISHRGEHVASLNGPGADEPNWSQTQWADLIIKAVDVAMNVSEAVKQSSTVEIKDALMKGALAALDEHSRYANTSQAQRQRDRREGFVGIGIRFSIRDKRAQVVEVFPEGPADRAKIAVNDIITHVDNKPIDGLSSQSIAELLRGRPGSSVEVILERPAAASAYLRKLRRSRVVPPTIKYRRDGRIVRLAVSGFNRHTGLTLIESLRRAKDELGPDLAGIILDLRGNPGGLLDQGVAVVDAFIGNGAIATTEGRHPDALHQFVASGEDTLAGKPLVVLINGRTASSSELVAAALQDRGRAILLGSSSYGKGSVQSVNDLPDDSELIITWSLIHAPSGYAFHKLGVLPTLCTSQLDSIEQAETAIRTGALPIRPALTQWRAAKWPRDKDERQALKALCPPSNDKPEMDLLIARKILLDQALYDRLLVQSRATLTAQSE